MDLKRVRQDEIERLYMSRNKAETAQNWPWNLLSQPFHYFLACENKGTVNCCGYYEIVSSIGDLGCNLCSSSSQRCSVRLRSVWCSSSLTMSSLCAQGHLHAGACLSLWVPVKEMLQHSHLFEIIWCFQHCAIGLGKDCIWVWWFGVHILLATWVCVPAHKTLSFIGQQKKVKKSLEIRKTMNVCCFLSS